MLQKGVLELRGTRWWVKVNNRKIQVVDNYDMLIIQDNYKIIITKLMIEVEGIIQMYLNGKE